MSSPVKSVNPWEPGRASRVATRVRWAVVAVLLLTALTIWPFYPAWGNSIEPRIAGLPWSLTYVLLVLCANFALLLGLYVTGAVDDVETEEEGQNG